MLGAEELHRADKIYWTDDAAERWATDLYKEPLTGDDDGMIESADESAASQQRINLTGPRKDRRDR